VDQGPRRPSPCCALHPSRSSFSPPYLRSRLRALCRGVGVKGWAPRRRSHAEPAQRARRAAALLRAAQSASPPTRNSPSRSSSHTPPGVPPRPWNPGLGAPPGTVTRKRRHALTPPPPPPGFALHDTAHPSRVPPRRAERELSFQSDGALVTPSPLVHLPTSRGQSFPSLEFLLECAPGVLPAQCLRDRHPTPSRADELLGLSDKESSPALSRRGSPSAAPEWAQAPLGVGPLLDKRRRPAGFEAGAPRSVLAGVGTGAGRAKTGRVATAGRAEGVGARRGCGAPDVSLVHAGVDIAQLFRADLARARAAEASGAEASDADGATGLAPARAGLQGGALGGARDLRSYYRSAKRPAPGPGAGGGGGGSADKTNGSKPGPVEGRRPPTRARAEAAR